ncbi:MAG: hypothetical protein ABIB43_05095, partial [archaeon]
MKWKYLFLMLFLLLVSIVSAVDYDYDNPIFYLILTAEQYSDLNYSKVDYSLLDYTKVDFSLITNHSEINSSKYFADLGCVGCSLERNGYNVTFSKTNISRLNSYIPIPGSFPPGVKFIAISTGFNIILPEDISSFDIPEDFSMTLNTMGRDVTLSNGMVVNGKLSFDNGQLFIEHGQMVTIDDVKLDSVAGRVNIFDDGFIHVGDYVSFGDSSVLIHGSDFNVEFLEGNRYVDVNSDEDDFFSVSPRNDGMISVINREDDGLSLEVVVSGNDGVSEWAKVSNGKFDMTVGSDGLNLNAFESLQGEFGSVPIDL